MISLIFSGAISKAMKSLSGMFNQSYQKEVEDYLSQSVDLNDLNQRVKLIKLRGFI